MSKDTMDKLLAALKSHDIALTEDDVQWAFDSVKTKNQAVAWVNEYLDNSTLLSKEELDLYNRIPKAVRQGHGPTQQPSVNVISEEELKNAVLALENSTAAIEQQNKMLEAQKKALLALKQHHEPDPTMHSQEENRAQRQIREIQHLNLLADEMNGIVSELVDLSQRDINAATSSLNSGVADRLAFDDRVFLELSKVSIKLQTEIDHTSEGNQVEQWCRYLTSLRSAEIRAHVDMVYHRGLADNRNGISKDGPLNDVEAEKSALKGELATLHEEISSILAMVVDHELRVPIMRSWNRSQIEIKNSRQIWLQYVLSTVEYMTIRLDALRLHANDLGGFGEALYSVSSAIAESNAESTTTNQQTLPQESPNKSKLALTKTPVFSLPSKPSTAETILRQLFRHIDLTVPLTSSHSKTVQMLDKAVKESSQALQQQHERSDTAVEGTLTEFLNNADSQLQSILRALSSDSTYGTVQLSDQAVGLRLQKLAADVDEIGAAISQGAGQLSFGEGSRAAQFIQKWNR